MGVTHYCHYCLIVVICYCCSELTLKMAKQNTRKNEHSLRFDHYDRSDEQQVALMGQLGATCKGERVSIANELDLHLRAKDHSSGLGCTTPGKSAKPKTVTTPLSETKVISFLSDNEVDRLLKFSTPSDESR